ncbi:MULTISPECIES: signal peptidase I [Micrococcaceae]|uniref:signal peptidase I n=1 Tax=Micrococcaceae TaxID=1268 RepID=UPI001622F785|nr:MULTISPECIES: signal peptidase I [Micrococcaceae]MBB5749542.1 signal peptidase [Micrococcus sp. TA1]HRO31432.1 signal peptidase I [Citricoccus sp.]
MNDSRVPRRSAPAWFQWIGQTVSFIALCFFALAAILLIAVPLVTGSQTYSVLTSSMAPKYPPGTFLVVKPTDFDQLRAGDVVTFQIESGRPEVITHRITGFTASQDGERLLITQGDNNDVADPEPVREIQVRGKLFYAVPYVGFVANALGNANRSTLVTILAVALIAWGALSMVRGAVRERREKRDQQLIEAATHQTDTVVQRSEEGR